MRRWKLAPIALVLVPLFCLLFKTSSSHSQDRPEKSPDQVDNRPKTYVDELPGLIAERLKRKINVDFKRTPMQDAFALIAQEIRTTITIDGDALKAGGFTKDMPQTLFASGRRVPLWRTSPLSIFGPCFPVDSADGDWRRIRTSRRPRCDSSRGQSDSVKT